MPGLRRKKLAIQHQRSCIGLLYSCLLTCNHCSHGALKLLAVRKHALVRPSTPSCSTREYLSSAQRSSSIMSLHLRLEALFQRTLLFTPLSLFSNFLTASRKIFCWCRISAVSATGASPCSPTSTNLPFLVLYTACRCSNLGSTAWRCFSTKIALWLVVTLYILYAVTSSRLRLLYLPSSCVLKILDNDLVGPG